MMINFSAIIHCNRGKSFLRTAGLAGFLILLLTNFGFAQEMPCLNLRNKQIKFVRASDTTAAGECRNLRRNLKTKQARGIDDISISGHVTHQNGVRMVGVTMNLEDIKTGEIRTVLTDDVGTYFFADVPFAGSYEITPMKEGYQFLPPSVIIEGLVYDEVFNFIASGPPPEPPQPPANQPTLAWTSYFDNTPQNPDSPQNPDYNAMLGRDAQGNVYVAGTSYAEDYAATGDTNIILYKTDTNGNHLWSRIFDGAGSYKDGAVDLAVDAAGNAYLAGYSLDDKGSSSYAVLKYNAAGNLLWTKYYNGNGGDSFPLSLKIDGSGNAYVTGYSWGNYANYATVKYDSNGNQMWAKRYVSGYGEIATEVEVDASGNVYVSGYSGHEVSGDAEDFVTIKYSSTGEQQWLNRYDSLPGDKNDTAYEMEINAAGDVIVMGESNDFITVETLLQKINGSSGATVWAKNFRVSQNNGDAEDYPSAMKLDGSGNIILAGMAFNASFYDVDSYVAKFNAEGVVQWVKIYDGPGNDDYDGDPKLALDANGNAYVGISSEGFANFDMQIIKYLPNGDQDWTYRFGSPFIEDDFFTEWDNDNAQTNMLLDAQGNLYVAGDSFVPNQAINLVAFKLEPQAQARAVPNDFDGDKKADIAVFRPETGIWYVLKSSDGNYTATAWGLGTDKLVPADYDGDGKIDAAVYRNGTWYISKSSDGTYSATNFGAANDKPIPSDYDNDGRADLSVFRQGIWHSLNSSDNSYKAMLFGTVGDIPIPSDYDSNRRSDIAVFRNGAWYVQYQAGLPTTSIQFGASTDKAVPADYDGDKKTDYAVFRQGIWYIWQSGVNSMKILQWGSQSDTPVPADYDGDRKTDIAVYRQGVWYILRSSDGNYAAVQFGLPTDVPLPSAYTR